MTCDEAETLLHALLDGELDAGHAREVEAHLAGCPRCAEQLRAARELKHAMVASELQFTAPRTLRLRLEAALPRPQAKPSRRGVLQGFALGSALSALAATGLVAIVWRGDDESRVDAEMVSAHLRSLQAGHLTDVLTSDQHTVKPWFNGRLDVAPPVVDLTAQGFMLIGGRLDYVDGRAVGAIVYRRRVHVINLFVAQAEGADHRPASVESVKGFNIRRWRERGLNFWAVSDLAAEELSEFCDKFEAAARAPG
jgi:anti-sigma factor RsiW